MKITVTFETDSSKDSHFDDLKSLQDILKLEDYKLLVFEFNEYLIKKLKHTRDTNHQLEVIEDIQKQWLEFIYNRGIVLE